MSPRWGSRGASQIQSIHGLKGARFWRTNQIMKYWYEICLSHLIGSDATSRRQRSWARPIHPMAAGRCRQRSQKTGVGRTNSLVYYSPNSIKAHLRDMRGVRGQPLVVRDESETTQGGSTMG